MTTQSFTVSHTGSVLSQEGDEVVRASNDAGRPDSILSFTCPRKFESIDYRGKRDATRAYLRTLQTVTGTANDDTVVDLENDIQPVAGEEDVAEQDEPVAVAYNVDAGAEVAIVDADYSANTVTLDSNPADGETVKVWSLISHGTIQMQGRNALGQIEGPVYPWSTRLSVFSTFPQNKRGRSVHMHGSVQWGRHETVEVLVESPASVVWEDEDYPRGEFVSTFEQDVRIEL